MVLLEIMMMFIILQCNSITLIRDSSHSHHYKSLSENKYDDEHICYSFQTAKPMSGFEVGCLVLIVQL